MLYMCAIQATLLKITNLIKKGSPKMILKKTFIASLLFASYSTAVTAAPLVPEGVTSINFKIDRHSQMKLKKGKFIHKKDRFYQLNVMLNSASFSKKIQRLHSSKSYDEFEDERNTYKRKGKLLPKLANWYRIPTKDMTETEIQDIKNELENMPYIEVVEYETPVISIAEQCPTDCEPDIPPGGGGGGSSTPDLQSYQDYLAASPLGVDAIYAWTKVGGNGSGVKIIDMENSYNQSHEDLPTPFIRYNDNADGDHGTAVMSVLGAKNDNRGVKGIAYSSQLGFYGWGGNTANSIREAANNLSAGDVLLLEGQINRNIYSGDTCNNSENSECVPMEWKQSYFDSIVYATAKGVIVVEAAGNGNENLDAPMYNNLFDRNTRDSGAFLIAATSSNSNFSRLSFSNYGSRIDFNAWGENVAAAGGYGNILFNGGTNSIYGDGFNGTSSASPIVAGAVASVVGHGKAHLGKTLSISEVRSLLANTGVPSPSGSVNVGVRPNLKNALDNIDIEVLPASPTIRSSWYGCYGENSISWDAVSNATSYQIFISPTTTPPVSPTYTQSSTNKFLQLGNDSYGWVKACNTEGCSDFSNRVSLRYENYCL